MATVEESITVLLVDDDPDLGAVTSMHLERQDDAFETQFTDSAAEALDFLDGDVDCIVSDYEMPERDGLDLLREVREYDATLPFVLFTGRGSEEIASEAISAGVTDYLQKGSGTDQYAVLANRIRNAVAHRRSVEAAAETKSRYQTLVESSPNAILVHDGEAIRYANDRLVELASAADAAEVYSCDPFTLIHPDDRERLAERVERVLQDRESADWLSWRFRRFDGEVRTVESRAAPVVFEGVRASQVVLRDVTDRYCREQRLEALHDATRRLLTAGDRGTVADIALDAVEDVFDESVAVVWEYDPERGCLAPLAATENAARIAEKEGIEAGVTPLPDWCVEMAVFESGDPRVVEDYADREDAVSDAFATIFMHPLGDYGLLAIGSTSSRTFDDAERDLVGILARSVAATFDRLENGE
jgi:PAS domain S-box-containing protein